MFALRQLAAAKQPADQARAIVEHRIPYRVAATVVRQMTPAVLVALIDQMSPQELINSLGSLRKRGALDSPEIKQLVDAKPLPPSTNKFLSSLFDGQRDSVSVPAEIRQPKPSTYRLAFRIIHWVLLCR